MARSALTIIDDKGNGCKALSDYQTDLLQMALCGSKPMKPMEIMLIRNPELLKSRRAQKKEYGHIYFAIMDAFKIIEEWQKNPNVIGKLPDEQKRLYFYSLPTRDVAELKKIFHQRGKYIKHKNGDGDGNGHKKSVAKPSAEPKRPRGRPRQIATCELSEPKIVPAVAEQKTIQKTTQPGFPYYVIKIGPDEYVTSWDRERKNGIVLPLFTQQGAEEFAKERLSNRDPADIAIIGMHHKDVIEKFKGRYPRAFLPNRKYADIK